MFMNFNEKATTVFLDPASQPSYVEGKLNIILSPSLYWVKKLSLPIDNLREVKKLLPSIFEESIPDGNYSYMVYRQGDEFFAFAYDDKLIIDLLAQKGITSANIAGVYLAQSELDGVQMPANIDENYALQVKDGIVILIPSSWVKNSNNLNIHEITLSKHKLYLKEYGHIVDSSSIYKVMAMLGVFILIFAAKYIITERKIDDLQSKKSELFSKYHLQPTMMQNRSVLETYKGIYQKQSKAREVMAYLLDLRLQPAQKLLSIEIKERSLLSTFDIADGSAQNIIADLSSKKLSLQTEIKDKILYVKVAL